MKKASSRMFITGKLLGTGSFITVIKKYWSSPAIREASPVCTASFTLTYSQRLLYSPKMAKITMHIREYTGAKLTTFSRKPLSFKAAKENSNRIYKARNWARLTSTRSARTSKLTRISFFEFSLSEISTLLSPADRPPEKRAQYPFLSSITQDNKNVHSRNGQKSGQICQDL